MNKIISLLVVVCMQVLTVFGQSSLAFSTEKAVQDFNYFVDLLEKTHVDPYTSLGGVVNFKRRVVQFENKCNNVRNVQDLDNLITEFLAYLPDNHTRVEVENASGNSIRQLPFFCNVASVGIYIRAIKEPYGRLYGSKILAINNISVDSLLCLSAKVESSENSSNLKSNLCWQIVNKHLASRVLQLEVDSVSFKLLTTQLDTVIQSFDYQTSQTLSISAWHKKPTRLSVDPTGIFSYQFVDTNRQIMYFRLDEMFAQEVVEMMALNHVNNGNWISSILDRFYPELVTKADAVQQIPYLSHYFREMLLQMRDRHAKYLILDLSKNGGGYSALAIPALYMLFGDTCFSKSRERKYITRISQLYLDKYRMSIDDYNKEQNTHFKIGDYYLGSLGSSESETKSNAAYRQEYFEYLQKNNLGWGKYIEDLSGKPIYTPHIIVLLSAKTNSAAYHFLCDLSKFQDITTLGIAPKQAGNTFMETTPFVLPNSKIGGSISNSMQIMFSDDDPKSHLFEPNFSLSWTDLQQKQMSGTAILEIALEWIQSRHP